MTSTDNLTSHQRNAYVTIVTPGGNFMIADPHVTIADVIGELNRLHRAGDRWAMFDIFSADPFSGLEDVPHQDSGVALDEIVIVTTARHQPEGMVQARESGIVVPQPKGVPGLNGRPPVRGRG